MSVTVVDIVLDVKPKSQTCEDSQNRPLGHHLADSHTKKQN